MGASRAGGSIRAGIVGGTGYTGVELLRLLAQHPAVELVAITSRGEAGTAVDRLFPSLRGRVALAFVEPSAAQLQRCDVVFFATPHGVAMSQARELLASGVRVIDLAADFRLRDTAEFERWYRMTHACPDLLGDAVYGLPEATREAIRRARIIAIPGCYPTSVLLGLLPLARLERERSGAVEWQGLIADCKSGVSGAGRKIELDLLAAEVLDNFRAYAVAGHRHQPEIEQELRLAAGVPVQLTFVPHLVPMIRGIHSTLYVRLGSAVDQDLQQLYERFYRDEPFVDVLPPGSCPDTRSVRGSNVARIAVHRPSRNLAVVLVVEDNLVKGAAGQAVQVMNIAFGRPETEGLEQIALLP
ncbi:MAG TPA: N-acetyl-gamma-glutamyl-phosphate reductase [Burkholderiaceae bacterium]|jgi:N-acetyl-gamma-glutamyl-phosphate reductase|nr:N-acetyl-gamma-glutamyl-phosphate reductase [Burkholderiaceae bacterium]